MSSHVTQPGAPESPHQNGERGSESRRQSLITLISPYLQTYHRSSLLLGLFLGNLPQNVPGFTVPGFTYEYVTFCHTCRRFDLYETEAEMKADDPKWW